MDVIRQLEILRRFFPAGDAGVSPLTCEASMMDHVILIRC